MKMSGVIICWLLAVLTLSCESAHQTLNSISDLKRIDLGRSVPKHSLLLLHWFANAVHIDRYNTITVNFNPERDFGSHYYGNSENRLSLPRGCRYYTVGNLYESTSNELPGYVQSVNFSVGRENSDRIIFNAERQYSGGPYTIRHVYLTQHEEDSNDYDPNHTYQISVNLLREIRRLGNHMELMNQFYFTEQSRPYLQSSSSNSGDGGGICACVAAVVMLIVIMFVFIGTVITLAPQK